MNQRLIHGNRRNKLPYFTAYDVYPDSPYHYNKSVEGRSLMGMHPYIRIRGCRLIEKMKTDPGYSDQLSLVNASTFCEIPIAEISRQGKKNNHNEMTLREEKK